MKIYLTWLLLVIYTPVYAQYEVYFDQRSGELSIVVSENTRTQEFNSRSEQYIGSSIKPLFYRTATGQENYGLIFTYHSESQAFESPPTFTAPLTIDYKRYTYGVAYHDEQTKGTSREKFVITLNRNAFQSIANSQMAELLINDKKILINSRTRNLIRSLLAEILAVESRRSTFR